MLPVPCQSEQVLFFYYTKKQRQIQLFYLKNSNIFCRNRNFAQNHVFDRCRLSCVQPLGLDNDLGTVPVQIDDTVGITLCLS